MNSRTSTHLPAVFVGGFIGTGMRWGLDTLIPHDSDQWTVSTLLIYMAGSSTVGYLIARMWHRPLPSWFQAELGTGVLETFTTFSAVAVALVTLSMAGEWITAVLYLVASLVRGLGTSVGRFTLGNQLHGAPVGLSRLFENRPKTARANGLGQSRDKPEEGVAATVNGTSLTAGRLRKP